MIMWQGSGIYRGTFGLVSNDNDFDDGDGYDFDDDNYSLQNMNPSITFKNF